MALPASAQAEVLVSNIGQASNATSIMRNGHYRGQSFSIASGSGNYTLSSIEIPFISAGISSTDIDSLSVSIWSTDSSSFPDSLLYALANPSSITVNTTAMYDAQAGARLQAGKTYAVVVVYSKTIASGGSAPGWPIAGTGEDADPESGWSIDDSGLSRGATATSWIASSGEAHKIRVNGAVRTAPDPPGAPTNLTAEADGGTRIDLTWDAPADDGGSAITGYRIEVSDDGSSGWTELEANTGSTDTNYTHTGLLPGDTRHYRVSAINANGTSEESNSDDATTAAPPTLSRASVLIAGTQVNLTFSESVDPVAEFLPTSVVNAFTVTVDGIELQIDSIRGGQIAREMHIHVDRQSKIYQGQTVVVSYDKSVAGTNALEDADDNEVASFTTGVAGVPTAINNSTQTPPLPAPTGFRAEAGDGEVTLSWNPPGSGSDVTHHDYTFRTNGSYGNWIEIDDSGPGETNASGFTVTRDIVNGTAYTFQLRAGGDDGDSLAAEAGRVTPEGLATGLAPTVTSVVVASEPQSGDNYRLYETILFTVTFSEPVELKPHGRLRLEVKLDDPGGASGNSVEAVFSRITREQYPTDDTPQFSRARHMHFEYKVQLFDRDANGVSIRANALRLGSEARIRSEGGVDAELDHAAVGPFSDHKVDARADVPRIERIRVVSTPRLRWPGSSEEDTYGEGENIRIGVRFDQPVHVEGEPTMALEVGDPCGSVCEARYESGSGTDTLVFAYLVLDVDFDRNGIAIPANPVEVVSGDSIRNDAGDEAHLSFEREGTQRDHKVDGSRAAGPYLSVEDAEAHEADRKMDFTVRLEPHGLGIVTVDYETRDGSARAGSDYTETSGTLRFNSLEMERTVTVPIIDDAQEDDGETFTLRLSNPEGAALRREEREATGTIRNSDPEATPLTASFEDVPAEHDGESAFTLRMAFSESLSMMNGRRLREDVVAVAGGRATNAGRVDRRRDLWELTVEPDSRADVTVTLAAGAACGTPGAICTSDGRSLSEGISTTVAGPADEGPQPNTPATGAPTIGGTPQVGGELTASTSDISDADGMDDARFAYQWLRTDTDIQGATGSTYTAVEADQGERLKVRVSFTDDAGNSESLTSAATDAVAARPEPLTASFEDVPAEHDGESAFTLRIASSDRLSRMNGRRLREDVVAVSGGRATNAGRVDRRRDLWELTVEPNSSADVTVTVAAGAACGTPAAVCTFDGRALSNTISATVRGPVGIAVADAHVEEDDGAVLVFAVTLSRAASRALTVDYATSDGSAQAGVDYTAASGTLTFQAGESSKTIEVGVLDDAHDEGEETLTLTLSGASGGLLTDGEATGTIENRDPLPRALLARFGRTAAVHVVEHVEERLQAPREPGFRGRFAGRELRRGMERDMALNFLRQLGGSAGVHPAGMGSHTAMAGSPAVGAAPLGTPGRGGGGALMMGGGGPMSGAAGMAGGAASLRTPGLGAAGVGGAAPLGAGPAGGPSGPHGGLNGGGFLQMGLGGGDLLTGSDFAMNRESRGGILSFWSRGAQSRFSGREGALSLGGDVRTTMFGADYARGPVVAGLSLSNSRGLGEYAGAAGGQVASSVTGLYPWLGYKMTERVTVWGVAGYGTGGLLLTPDGGQALESGLSMAMAAAGTRGELLAGGASGFGLAFKADALWVGTAIDGVDGPAGRLKATDAAVTRFRTGLEGSRAYTLAGRLSLKPSVEVGLRHDGGDAETGAGMDVGAGMVLSDAGTGLAVDLRVRTLLVHQDENFSERGVSLSLSYNPTPSTPLGFVARVAPSWGGQAMSGAEALWGRETMAGMAQGGVAQGNRLDGEVGYGLPVGRRFVGTPRIGFSASEYGQDYRVGYGLGVLDRESMNFELGVEAQRRNSPTLGGASNGMLGRATLGW